MWGIRFDLKYSFPLLKYDDVRDSKILISMNSSTSFDRCDSMFVADFLRFDSMVAEEMKRSQESIQQLYNTIGGFTR